MNYIYKDQNSINLDALAQWLNSAGVYQHAITHHSDCLIVDADDGFQSAIDTAVTNAQLGSLFSNKSLRIAEVKKKSALLLEDGVDNWEGKKVELSKTLADNYYVDYTYLSNNLTRITNDRPYLVFTLDGRASHTVNVADILVMANNATDRLVEIYTNEDGIKPDGELKLVLRILAAADQAALDAVIDERV